MLDTRPRTALETHPAEPIASLYAHTRPVAAVAFSPDRCQLVSMPHDGAGIVWDLTANPFCERAQVRKAGASFRAVAFSPNGRAMAAGAAGGSVSVFDLHPLAKWQVERAFCGHGLVASASDTAAKLAPEVGTLSGGARAVRAVVFSHDGNFVAAAGEDHVTRVWDIGAPTPEARAVLTGHTRPVLAVAFAPDGRGAATAGQDATARVWAPGRIRSSQRLCLPHAGPVHALAYSPDGHLLVTAGDAPVVRVWDATALKPTVLLEVPGHAGGTRLVLVTPDGETLVTAGLDNRAARWSLRTGRAQSVWALPPVPASCLASTPDGRYLARGTADGLLDIHRIAEKRT